MIKNLFKMKNGAHKECAPVKENGFIYFYHLMSLLDYPLTVLHD